MNTPDVIMSETSNGTKYAMAKSTDLKAIEKKYPEKNSTKNAFQFLRHFFYDDFFIPHAVAMFITKIVSTDVNTKA